MNILAITRISVKNQLAFKANVTLGGIHSFFQVYVMVAVWGAVSINQGMSGKILQEYVTYSILTLGMSTLLAVSQFFKPLKDKIKSGEIQYEINRPYSFMTFLCLRFLGSSIVRLFLSFIPICIIGYFGLNMIFPENPVTLALFIVSLIFAFFLQFLVWYLFALITFFGYDNLGVLMAYVAVISILSGLSIPIEFYPEWIRVVIEILPFQGIYSIPAEIYLERIEGFEVLNKLLTQVVWIVILWPLGKILYHFVIKKSVNNGG